MLESSTSRAKKLYLDFFFFPAQAVSAIHHGDWDDAYCHMSFDAGCILARESLQSTRIIMAGLLYKGATKIKAGTNRQAGYFV